MILENVCLINKKNIIFIILYLLRWILSRNLLLCWVCDVYSDLEIYRVTLSMVETNPLTCLLNRSAYTKYQVKMFFFPLLSNLFIFILLLLTLSLYKNFAMALCLEHSNMHCEDLEHCETCYKEWCSAQNGPDCQCQEH